jgi:hypothetical protein
MDFLMIGFLSKIKASCKATRKGPGQNQPKDLTMAWAHSDIKPPGKRPSAKIKRPLILNNQRTSHAAETLLTVNGWSKYMTLMTLM